MSAICVNRIILTSGLFFSINCGQNQTSSNPATATKTGDASVITTTSQTAEPLSGDAGGSAALETPKSPVATQATALTQRLRGHGNFMVGMGNDGIGNDAMSYNLSVPLDMHYAYITGYGDQGGWPTWNTNGDFAKYVADSADEHQMVPFFTYYALALNLEQSAGSGVLGDSARMHQWLKDVRLLFQKLAAFNKPAVVHFEPDFMGFLQNRMREQSTDPSKHITKLKFDDITECGAMAELAENLFPCVKAMRDVIAPKVVLGASSSSWGAFFDNTDPNADVVGSATSHGNFLRAMRADTLDFIVVETLDRDAGFWEANGGQGACSVKSGPRGAVYWDESNTTFPNFSQHFQWITALTTTLNLPAIWWQTPFGVPANSCGGVKDAWRDNRVHYFFSHIDQLIAAGGVGLLFGTGAGDQTFPGTDGGQFKTAVQGYFASPVALPQ